MKTLAWDVDDVLFPTLETWLEVAWRPDHPEAPDYAGLVANPPHEVLGVSRAEYLASLDDFRRSAYERMAPRSEVLAFFEDRGHRYRHVALTATPRHRVPWVAKHVFACFGDWIRTFGFVPSPRPGEALPAYDTDKGAWLGAVGGADLLLDDSPHNVVAARAVGIEAWVVGQPWNEGEPLGRLLARL